MEETILDGRNCGIILKSIRKERKKTIEAFAKRIGVSGNTIMAWQSGETIPKTDMFCDILAAFGYEVIVRKKVQNEEK